MIERAESKSLLILLLLLSILALICSIITFTLEIIWNHIGFLMSSANYTFLCSTYQTLKLHYNIIYNYNAIFIGCCTGIIFQLFTLIHLVYLVVSYYKKQQKYLEQFTESVFQRLYIGYSMSMLGICVGVADYFSYIIEQGWNCLNYTYVEWMVLGSFFSAALLFLLICWIYLLCFWSANKQKFDQPKNKTSYFSQSLKQPVVAGEQYQTIDQAIKSQPQEDIKEIKQSLLDDTVNPIQQEDDGSSIEQNDKQKLTIIPFEDYIKKQKEKENKEKREMQLILKLLQEEEENIMKEQRQKQAKMEEQRIKKQNFKNQALSPDDPNFDKMFVDSQEQSQKEIKQQQKSKLFFPANFNPQNEKEQQEFQNYKKSLLEKYRNSHIPGKKSLSSIISAAHENTQLRHPQNIEGGRSKRLMSKYMSISKRPMRDLSMYGKKNQNLQKSIDKYSPMIQEQNQYSARPRKAFQNKAQILFEAISPKAIVDPNPHSTFQQPEQIEKQMQKKPSDPDQHAKQTLCFHKSKEKSPSRKILFEQQKKFFTNQAFTSILNSLVIGVEKSNMKKKLKELRQKRYRREQGHELKPGKMLLDEIRSKYT